MDIIMNNKNYLNIEITRPTQELIIMRGVPGSGKSTEAKKLVGEGVIHSTDSLIEAAGDYKAYWDNIIATENPSIHQGMHDLNVRNAKQSMLEGISPVIIDNTNLNPTQCKRYVRFALEEGFDDVNIKLVNIGTNGCSAEVLTERNTHFVSLEVINKMINRYKTFENITIKDIMESKDEYLYCAVVLDDTSKQLISDTFNEHIPSDWKVFNHHMTIRFGKGLPEDLKGDVGTTVSLKGVKLGMSDMAVALGVEGYFSNNEKPHITIAVNVKEGGKPVMSNDIENWVSLSKPFTIKGVVTEFTK